MQNGNSPQPSTSRSAPHSRDLAAYTPGDFDPGRGFVVRTLWYAVSVLFFESSWFPVSRPKAWILQIFGAKIGRGLVIRPNVRIKFPWKLRVGDHCWIGREVWIDNLDHVTLESDICISQGAYLCTGSHDHRSPTFELLTHPIHIEHGAWIACRAVVLGGTTVQRYSVIPAGSVFTRHCSTGTSAAGE